MSAISFPFPLTALCLLPLTLQESRCFFTKTSLPLGLRYFLCFPHSRDLVLKIFSGVFVLQICVSSYQFSLAFTPLKIFLSPMTNTNPTLLGPFLPNLPGRPLSLLVFKHWTIICHSTFQTISFLKQLFLFPVATSLSWKFTTMS